MAESWGRAMRQGAAAQGPSFHLPILRGRVRAAAVVTTTIRCIVMEQCSHYRQGGHQVPMTGGGEGICHSTAAHIYMLMAISGLQTTVGSPSPNHASIYYFHFQT